MSHFTGQHFAILGAGRSGLGAARLARLHGAEVTVFDEGDPQKMAAAISKLEAENFRSVTGEAAKQMQVKAGDFQLVIVSPGIDESWPLPQKFTQAGVPLVGETEFAFTLTQTALVAITGTNGKSTCTELIAHLFNHCGQRSLPCGNHGVSLSEVIASGEPYDVLALEVSSFQLETIRTFRAGVNIWLNFAPDHLDRYPSEAAYFSAKARLFMNCTADDIAIVRAGESVDTGVARRITFSAFGAEADYTFADGVFFHQGQRIGDASGIRLRGRHNMENILAAIIAGHAHGLGFEEMLSAIQSYEPPAHRCELVRTWAGREFINDSKATNLHALEACIASLDGPIVLIVGGKEKGLDYSDLRAGIKDHVKAMVCIGEIGPALAAAFGDLIPCTVASSLEAAVNEAARLSQAGDSIVLSPGTSSFDMFTGYAQRGEVYRRAVMSLS